MPIKPENKHRYPANWKEIRAAILLRANNCCEKCGVENYSIIWRDDFGNWHYAPEGYQSDAMALDGTKFVKIILTIAHLDHQPENNDERNLSALCQKCHLNYDKNHHRESRKKTRFKNQPELFSSETNLLR